MKIELKVGDKVELLEGGDWGTGRYPPAGTVVNVIEVEHAGFAQGDKGSGYLTQGEHSTYGRFPIRKVESSVSNSEVAESVVVPDHYLFPGGVRVHQISGYLTSFAGQALQYIARSSRLDGANKGDTVEDLKKARRFLDLEIERLENNA